MFRSFYRISIPEPSLKHLQAIARRLYRIFAHAYFHHRETFEFFEVQLYCILRDVCMIKSDMTTKNETCLHSRFLRLSQKYSLIPKSLLIIPHDSESNEQDTASQESHIILSRRSSTSTVQEIADDGETSPNELSPTDDNQEPATEIEAEP
jgi:hypothetical protein